MAPGRDDDTRRAAGSGTEAESLAEVLASIRALVSAEAEARQAGTGEGETVLMLTAEMRADERASSGEVLAEGLETEGTAAAARPRPTSTRPHSGR